MKRRLAPFWILLAVVGAGGTARAHPGHEDAGGPRYPDPLRTWTITGETEAVNASFVMQREGEVRLRKTSSEEMTVALARLSAADQEWVRWRMEQIRALNAGQSAPVQVALAQPTAQESGKRAPAAAKAFEPFKKVKVSWDDRYLYVASDGMPDHPMMKGIRSWQQQVPLPQPYTGTNSWRIPLKPVLSKNPVSARTGLFRGAIALAVNGVPIFNALNNRGEDTYLAGELDEWGGHCGRADDYHYHMAPLHLQKTVGKDQPIAYALDGFPIYGLTNPDGSPAGPLDEFNGKPDGKGGYRYYATLKYPYVNGGLRGVVEVRGDQVEPQPRSIPVRPALPPLPGATITAFQATGENAYRLTCELQGRQYTVAYSINKDGTYTFTYTDGYGNRRTDTYRRQDQRDRPPPPR